MINQMTSPASANKSHIVGASPLFSHTVAAFRRVLWPWLYVVVFMAIQRAGTNWDAPVWGVLQYLYLAASVAVAVFVILPGTSKSTALLNAGIAFLLLFLPGLVNYLLSNSLTTYNINGIEHVIFGAGIASRAFYPVALGALIVAVITRRPLQWLAMLISPVLQWPLWAVLVRHSTPPGMIFPDYYFIFSIVHVPIASLVISIPAAVLAWVLWKPDQAFVSSHPASQSALLTREILRKELRLQRNNILFTVATFILGIIGLITVNAADPSVASFNVEDIRDALLSVILLPLLTLVLPLMMGSTAAAGEKAMGVQGWQTALPVSLRRIVALKFLVIIGLLLIISGVLPYILSVVAVESTTPVNAVFRYTWPVWLAFLFAAMGYYSGTLARDDYQGLLISLGPITLLIVAMTYADPLRLVFPAYIGWQEPLMKQYLVAGRLLIIAGFFIISAMHLQRRPGQRKLRLIAAQAALLVVGTFILTLVNIVGERSVLRPPQQTVKSYPAPYPRSGSLPVPPQPIASAGTPTRSYNILFDQELELPFAAVAGTINRHHTRQYNLADNPHHLFVAMPGGRVREFSQALNSRLIGLSRDGHWMLAIGEKSEDQMLCGPGGLTVHSEFVPRLWFDSLVSAAGIQLTGDFANTLKTIDVQMQWPMEVKGNDLLVQAETRGAIQIRDGATLITHPKQRWYRVQLLNDNFIMTMMPQNTDTTTETAVLKPLPEHGHFEIEAIVAGDIRGISTDRKWAMVGTGWPDIIVRAVLPLKQQSNMNTGPREHRLSYERQQEDGTTITVINPTFVPMIANGTPYLAWYYNVHGPVTIGTHTVSNQVWLGAGALVLNLETGTETLIPFKFGWDQQTSLDLLEHFRAKRIGFPSWQHSNFTVHPQGAIAASHQNMVAILKPVINSWKSSEVTYIASMVPSSLATQIRFLTQDELLATDGTTLYQIKIPPTPKLRPN